MLSKLPLNIDELNEADIDKELLRLSLVSELDAISLYEQCAATTKDEDMKRVYEDIIKEEKTHIGEFQSLLLRRDTEQNEELVHGDKEVDDITEQGSEEE